MIYILELQQVGRRVTTDGQWLIRNVSLTLAPSERLVICGRSGSGKSVLLRVLAMLDPCHVGQILWQGKPVSDAQVPRFRSQCIYLHQRAPMLEGSVEENLKLPYQLANHRSLQYDPEFIVDWLRQVGRDEEFLRRSSDDLSGGERQMVALLRAIQLNPQVLLLDEPTSAADSETESIIEELIDRWFRAESDRALVWVTHDRAQASRMGDRQIIVEAGALQKEGGHEG